MIRSRSAPSGCIQPIRTSRGWRHSGMPSVRARRAASTGRSTAASRGRSSCSWTTPPAQSTSRSTRRTRAFSMRRCGTCAGSPGACTRAADIRGSTSPPTPARHGPTSPPIPGCPTRRSAALVSRCRQRIRAGCTPPSRRPIQRAWREAASFARMMPGHTGSARVATSGGRCAPGTTRRSPPTRRTKTPSTSTTSAPGARVMAGARGRESPCRMAIRTCCGSTRRTQSA